MKLICKKNSKPLTSTKGKITRGKTYSTVNIEPQQTLHKVLIVLEDDTGLPNVYSQNCFSQLWELRDIKLGKIGI